MDRVAFKLGPLTIYWYSIFIALGLIVGSIFLFKEAKKKNISEDFLVNLIFYTVIIAIIGARAYYVLFNLPYYSKHPLEIFAIWERGLAIHGAIIAGVIFIYYYCKKSKVNFLEILDIVVVGLIIGQAIGRWGNFFNSEAYGQITSLAKLKAQGIPMFIIKGMYILGEYREPTFFYESVWCLLGFIILLSIRKFSKKLRVGQLTGTYLTWYSIGRFFIEGRRTDSLMLGPLRMAQIVSIICIILGLILIIFNKKILKKDELYHQEDKKLCTKK